MCFEGPGQNVPEYSWWDYINTGAVGCVVLLVAKISVSSLEVRINFDTMVLGRRFRILVTSFLISLITCITNGILFFPLHNMMYFLKLSHINDARVWPALPSYNGCMSSIMAMIVSLQENVWLMLGKKVCVTCDIKCCIEGQVWRACFMSSLVSVFDSLRQFLQKGESSIPIWCNWLLNRVFPIFNLERMSLASLLW